LLCQNEVAGAPFLDFKGLRPSRLQAQAEFWKILYIMELQKLPRSLPGNFCCAKKRLAGQRQALPKCHVEGHFTALQAEVALTLFLCEENA
jgi:hypothetical protein